MAFDNSGKVRESTELVEKSLKDLSTLFSKKNLSLWDKIKFFYYNFKYKFCYKF